MSAAWKGGMCGTTFNPNVNVSLWCEESAGRTAAEQRGRNSDAFVNHTPKCCWSVSGREKVRPEMTEGKKERQAACVFMLRRD